MDDPGVQLLPLGTHMLRIDGDSLELIARGSLNGDDMRELLERFAQIKRKHGQLFVIYDGRASTGVDAEARRVASRLRRDEADANLRVAFGISFTVRVIMLMILRAQSALLQRKINVHVFEDEQQARAFFNAERDKLRAEFKASKSL
jgi:hypothetical protein